MTIPSSKIQQDFDRISVLPEEEWNHNNAHESFLLRHLPLSSEMDALEIGCGTGRFSRLLARRFHRVVALDLSPRSIEIAKERSVSYSNIDYQAADVLTQEFSPGQFGCIVSIATLHHLPLEAMLIKMKNALHSDGTLLVLDLYKAESLGDYAFSLAAFPVNIILKGIKNGRIRESAAARAAWQEHGRTDFYPTLSQVRRACASVLPGALITRHLLWRYSIVWKGGQCGRHLMQDRLSDRKNMER